jgi:hypothetical protein
MNSASGRNGHARASRACEVMCREFDTEEKYHVPVGIIRVMCDVKRLEGATCVQPWRRSWTAARRGRERFL